ncbi:MAG: beta-glucosidase [Spirochaetaceae bacterium]|jgi:beta-glucosidase|nr:beta-glucosidase [Spirochaetaceae bacterium]
MMSFPKDFVWGVASAAYQIEGGVREGGRSPSIWDTFSHTPGRTFNGHTGDVACDHYHRYAEDIALIAAAGIRNYRFSVSWPRILPEGRGPGSGGAVNPEGLGFYDRIVDLCLEKGITPYLTLYHWDLPQVLEDDGGWLNRKTAFAFAELAKVVAEHFKGRIGVYFTLNEPQCSAGLGYASGIHAPGKTLPPEQQFTVMHTLLLAHGLAAKEIRRADNSAKVGLASTGRLCYPEPDTPANRAAAAEAAFPTGALIEAGEWFLHHWVLDAVVFGRYPDTEGSWLDPLVKAVPPEDWAVINEKPDIIGLNIYNGGAVYRGSDGAPQFVPKYEGYPRTALKWPVTPEVMRFGVNSIWERYGLPIYITENGQSCNDRIFLDGKIHDPDRIDFLHRYLSELKKAVADGSDVRGYFHWCFTDNYEWHSGYDDRFGLVYIDYPTLRRIPKDSYYWYSGVAAENGGGI